MIPFGFFKGGLGSSTPYVLPDLSGYGISYIWMHVKTQQSTIDYCARVSRNGLITAGNLKYVFYDSFGRVSMDSIVSDTTTPGTTTVKEWIISNSDSDEYTYHTFYDQISGDELGFVTLVNSPIFASGGEIKTRNLEPAMKFQGVATGELVGTALPEMNDTNDFSVLTLSNLATPIGQVDTLISSTNVNSGAFSRFGIFNRGDSEFGVILRTTTPTTFLGSTGGVQNNSNQKEIVVTYEDEVEMKTFLDATNTDTDAITGAFINDSFNLGIDRGSLFASSGLLQAVLVADRVWTPAEVTSLRVIMNDIFKYDLDLNLVTDGNSLTFGFNATAGNTYPELIEDRLTFQGTTNVVTNKSLGGQTTQQMEADAATDIDPLIDPLKRNVLLAWECRNDMIVNSLTPTEALNNMITFCNNRRTAGWEVIVANVLPSWIGTYKGDSTVVGYDLLNTERLQLNALLQAGWQTFADGFVDFSVEDELYLFHNNEQAGYVFSSGTPPTTSDNGYYSDGTHGTDAGYSRISNIFFTELSKLINK